MFSFGSTLNEGDIRRSVRRSSIPELGTRIAIDGFAPEDASAWEMLLNSHIVQIPFHFKPPVLDPLDRFMLMTSWPDVRWLFPSSSLPESIPPPPADSSLVVSASASTLSSVQPSEQDREHIPSSIHSRVSPVLSPSISIGSSTKKVLDLDAADYARHKLRRSLPSSARRKEFSSGYEIIQFCVRILIQCFILFGCFAGFDALSKVLIFVWDISPWFFPAGVAYIPCVIGGPLFSPLVFSFFYMSYFHFHKGPWVSVVADHTHVIFKSIIYIGIGWLISSVFKLNLTLRSIKSMSFFLATSFVLQCFPALMFWTHLIATGKNIFGVQALEFLLSFVSGDLAGVWIIFVLFVMVCPHLDRIPQYLFSWCRGARLREFEELVYIRYEPLASIDRCPSSIEIVQPTGSMDEFPAEPTCNSADIRIVDQEVSSFDRKGRDTHISRSSVVEDHDVPRSPPDASKSVDDSSVVVCCTSRLWRRYFLLLADITVLGACIIIVTYTNSQVHYLYVFFISNVFTSTRRGAIVSVLVQVFINGSMILILSMRDDAVSSVPLLAVQSFMVVGTVIGYFLGVTVDSMKWFEYRLKSHADINAQLADSKSAFLSRMSHELRTPLNGIVFEIDYLAEHLSSDFQDSEETIRECTLYMRRLVDDILDFERMDSGNLSLSMEQFSLGSLVGNINRMMRRLMGRRNFSVQLDLDVNKDVIVPSSSDVETYTDAQKICFVGDIFRIEQILINLLSNAVKFTDESGNISLRIYWGSSSSLQLNPSSSRSSGSSIMNHSTSVGSSSPSGDSRIRRQSFPLQEESRTVAFEISDSGLGISQDQLPRIFLAFQQVSSGRNRRFGGSGLGLAICRRLVELMNGRIRVQSELGRGSVFTVILPLPMVKPLDDEESYDVEIRDALSPFRSGGDEIAVPDDTLHSPNSISLSISSSLTQYRGSNHTLSCAREDQRRHSIPSTLMDVSASSWSGPPEKASSRKDSSQCSSTPHHPEDVVASDLESGVCLADNVELPEMSMFPVILDSSAALSVLIVDDNRLNQRVLHRHMSRMFPGARVEIADDGLACLSLLFGGSEPSNIPCIGSFHLILMDYHMPGLDGLETTRRLRSANVRMPSPYSHQRCIIAFFSADVLQETRDAAIDVGCDVVFSKPIQPKELSAHIEKFIVIRSCSVSSSGS